MVASRPTGRGYFIVIEGLDGAGTTTQASRLRDWLVAGGREVQLTREPSTGPFGAVLRQVIDGRVRMDARAMALGFAADRIDHLSNESAGIEPALDRGQWVVCDRYLLSSLAYQTGQGVPLDWLLAINRLATVPDATIFVDTPPSVCLDRIRARNESAGIFDGPDELSETQKRYREAIDRDAPVGHLIRIDGSSAVESVFAEIRAALERWLDTVA
jgi:dTMP kinase